jgi:hypothetical protein
MVLVPLLPSTVAFLLILNHDARNHDFKISWVSCRILSYKITSAFSFCAPAISLVTNYPSLWRSVILTVEVTVNEKKINRPLFDRWIEMPFGLPPRFNWGLCCSGIISLIITAIISTRSFRCQKRMLGWVALFCCCFCNFLFSLYLVQINPSSHSPSALTRKRNVLTCKETKTLSVWACVIVWRLQILFALEFAT